MTDKKKLKLHQLLAISNGEKSRAKSDLDKCMRAFGQAGLFYGMNREFRAIDDEGPKLPRERTKVQLTVGQLLEDVMRTTGNEFNVEYQKDCTNQEAKADVIIDGKILVHSAPVSFLLYLEKQLNQLMGLVKAIPLLDTADDWNYDTNAGTFKTDPQEKLKTQKKQKPIVMYEATDKHPAQVQMVSEDVPVGSWVETKESGAVPATDGKKAFLRVQELLKAVQTAREEANSQEVVAFDDVGDAILNHVFGGLQAS